MPYITEERRMIQEQAREFTLNEVLPVANELDPVKGDIPASLRYPNIGVNDGGTVDGMMAAGRQLMTIVRPETKIIPGHLGPIVGFKEIEQQLAMFAAVRERVLTAIRAGRTVAQVVAAKPTKDFDEGRLGGAITPDRFVELVYTDLSRSAK